MIGILKCGRCIHNIDPTEKEWKCKAFPEGIPKNKLCYITRDPCIDCNNGIGYEPINEKPNETAQQ